MARLKCLICRSLSCIHVSHLMSFSSVDPDTPSCVSEMLERKCSTKTKRPTILISSVNLSLEFKKLIAGRPPDYMPYNIIDGEAKIILIASSFKNCAPCVEENHILDTTDVVNSSLKHRELKLFTREQFYECAC